MQIKPGMVVKSLSGHDQARFYLVVKTDEDFVYIADGKRRMLSKPKRKNPRHLQKTNRINPLKETDTDRKIRRALHDLNYNAGTVAEQGG